MYQIIQKNSSKNEVYKFNMHPTPSKALSDHTRKRRLGKGGPFLSFTTKCKCRATYDLNVEAISFGIGRGWRS